MTEEEIKALTRILDRVDYYRLLKTERGASSAEIRSAYHEARRRFHPDSFLRHDDEIRSAVDRIARRITEGYVVLRDSRKRSAYTAGLESGALRYTSEMDEQAKARPATSAARLPTARSSTRWPRRRSAAATRRKPSGTCVWPSPSSRRTISSSKSSNVSSHPGKRRRKSRPEPRLTWASPACRIAAGRGRHEQTRAPAVRRPGAILDEKGTRQWRRKQRPRSRSQWFHF